MATSASLSRPSAIASATAATRRSAATRPKVTNPTTATLATHRREHRGPTARERTPCPGDFGHRSVSLRVRHPGTSRPSSSLQYDSLAEARLALKSRFASTDRSDPLRIGGRWRSVAKLALIGDLAPDSAGKPNAPGRPADESTVSDRPVPARGLVLGSGIPLGHCRRGIRLPARERDGDGPRTPRPRRRSRGRSAGRGAGPGNDRSPLGDPQRLRLVERLPPLDRIAERPAGGPRRTDRGPRRRRPLARSDRRAPSTPGSRPSRRSGRPPPSGDRRRPPGNSTRPGRCFVATPGGSIAGPGSPERLADGPVSLDGIAKGLIVERACEAAIGSGVRGALLNVGGDLCARGEGPWIVGLAPPLGDSESAEPTRFLEIRNASLATSGPAHRGFRIGDRRYSHLIDPRSGRPVERVVAATVVAPRGLDADALATALNVLTIDEGLPLVESLPGVECLIVSAEGRTARSDGWELLEHPGPIAVARNIADDPEGPSGNEGEGEPAWGTTHELVVDFEINRPEAQGGRYRRPFVVIWIEDEEDHVVRHLLMWVSMGGAGPEQWLPDLARWYRSDAARGRIGKRSRAYAIGRSTRPPGSYSATWDGTGDDGKALPSGRYTLFIEAAREHGTHQLIRTPITVGGEAFEEELGGGRRDQVGLGRLPGQAGGALIAPGKRLLCIPSKGGPMMPFGRRCARGHATAGRGIFGGEGRGDLGACRILRGPAGPQL